MSIKDVVSQPVVHPSSSTEEDHEADIRMSLDALDSYAPKMVVRGRVWRFPLWEGKTVTLLDQAPYLPIGQETSPNPIKIDRDFKFTPAEVTSSKNERRNAVIRTLFLAAIAVMGMAFLVTHVHSFGDLTAKMPRGIAIATFLSGSATIGSILLYKQKREKERAGEQRSLVSMQDSKPKDLEGELNKIEAELREIENLEKKVEESEDPENSGPDLIPLLRRKEELLQRKKYLDLSKALYQAKTDLRNFDDEVSRYKSRKGNSRSEVSIEKCKLARKIRNPPKEEKRGALITALRESHLKAIKKLKKERTVQAEEMREEIRKDQKLERSALVEKIKWTQKALEEAKKRSPNPLKESKVIENAPPQQQTLTDAGEAVLESVSASSSESSVSPLPGQVVESDNIAGA